MDNRETFDWWKAKKSVDLYEKVHGLLAYLNQNQGHRSTRNLRNVRMYGNFDINNLQAYSFMRKESSYSVQNRVTLNVVRSMVDTATSKITKNKPIPTFLTSGGDWNAQQKAKDLSKFVEGMFYSTDLYKLRTASFKDGCIFGTGAVKIFKQGKKIKAERVFPEEIIVDDVEGFYGSPRQMHQTKYIHKDVLISMFPDKRGAIETVNEQRSGYNSIKPKHTDLVLVVESWKKPSAEGLKDGRHVITIANATLLDEKYEKMYFPFIFDRWNDVPFGFYGQGLADQLEGIQLEINKILRTIQISMHLVSIPKIFVEAGSKVVESHLDNKIGGIIRYAGTPPTQGQLGSIPRELFQHLEYLYNRAYEITGISQLSAQSSKPTGLNSGKALRIYNDLESERFMDVATRYEAGFIEAASIMIDFAKELDEEYKSEGGFKVLIHGKADIKELKWSDVDLERDQYVMKMYSTSALSKSPAGRLQEVQELLEAGFIDVDQGRKLLDFPDLENYYNMATASTSDIEKQIQMIMDDNKYQSPEPFQNLAKGIEMFQSAYLYYKAKGAPESKLELMRRWMDDANDLMQQAINAMQPPVEETAIAQMAPPAPNMEDILPEEALQPEPPIA